MNRWVIAAALTVSTVTAVSGSATSGASNDESQVVRLECAVRAAATADALAAQPVVHCRWSEPHVPPATAVRLWRLVDPGSGHAREVVYRSDDLTVQEFTDDAVRRGHVYLYAVQLLDEDGRIVGRSRVEVVRILPARVDGQGRELVASFPAGDQTTYRDPVPPGASRLVYALIVTDADGRIVGRSRPETVAIPPDRPTSNTRPPDTRPVATEPPETRPPETRPPETRPVDTRPANTEPTDTRPAPVTTAAAERPSGERGGP